MQIYVQQLSAYIADKSSVQPREQRGHCDGGAAPPPATGRSAATGGLCGEGGSSISVPDFSRKHTQTHTHTRTHVHTHPRTQAGTAHTHISAHDTYQTMVPGPWRSPAFQYPEYES